MEKNRLQQWIDNSHCIRFIDMTLHPDVQGLGMLDVELIKETERLKTKSKIDRKTKLKHLTLSKLWILEAYNIVRLMTQITSSPEHLLISQKTKSKIQETKKEFEKIRIPLTKFQMPIRQFKILKRQRPQKQNRTFSQYPDSFLDSSGEVGWKVHTTIERRPIEIYYRRSFGDLLLKLFESIDEDVRTNILVHGIKT